MVGRGKEICRNHYEANSLLLWFELITDLLNICLLYPNVCTVSSNWSKITSKNPDSKTYNNVSSTDSLFAATVFWNLLVWKQDCRYAHIEHLTFYIVWDFLPPI